MFDYFPAYDFRGSCGLFDVLCIKDNV